MDRRSPKTENHCRKGRNCLEQINIKSRHELVTYITIASVEPVGFEK